MRNKSQVRYILLAVVAVVVCIHVMWGVIAIFLPWALAALIFMWLGGIGRIFFRRWRRW